MKQSDWIARTKPPTLEQINARVIARIRFLERELKERGFNIAVGVEQEFFVLDEQRQPWNKSVDLSWLEETPFLDYTYKENLAGIYEIVLGNPDNRRENLAGKYGVVRGITEKEVYSCHSPTEIVTQLEKLKKILPNKLLAVSGIPHVSLKASEDYSLKATAGLHINLSISDGNGKNLFYGKSEIENFSPLAQHCAHKLVELQKDGLVFYAPEPASYKRVGRHDTAPKHLCVKTDKGNSSVAFRSMKNDGARREYPKSCRIEDRLAGADANPYLILLADIGAIHSAITKHDHAPHLFEPIMMHPDPAKMHAIAFQRFEQSRLWREVAGEELHRDLVAYFKAQSRGKDVITPP